MSALRRRDKFAIALLLVAVVGFGVLVELRSAFMKSRHTDLGVYLRAAWAVREGTDPYAVTDNNGWHYTSPTLLAVALVPFADAPPGVPQPTWAVPYAVSVALWYLVSVALFFWSAHALCRVLDETRPGPLPPSGAGGRRFWWLRAWPVWICLPAAGSSLSRGQVNLVVLALLTAFIAATLRGRRASAGWWLAAAVCLKVIPGLLILYPLVRRDWRTLGHCALGLFVGLVLIPLAAFGPERTVSTTKTFVENTLLAGLTSAPGRFSRELTSMTATDNQSIRGILHNAQNLDPATRPALLTSATKAAHAVLAAALLIWTFVAARRIPDERYRALFVMGGLTILAVAITPVNHTHYMVFALPVVVGLVHYEYERRSDFTWGPALIVVVALHLLSGILPRLPFVPGYVLFRDLGVTMLGTLVVWYAGLRLPAGAPRPDASRPDLVRLPAFGSRFGRSPR